MTPTPSGRHLRLVRPPDRGAGPDEPTVADLIAAATAWSRVQVAPRPPDRQRTRHLALVRDACAVAAASAAS